MGKSQSGYLDPHQTAFVGTIRELAYRHRLHEVFRDFCEVSAIAISNSVDLLHRKTREARYLEVVKRYNREEIPKFSELLAHVVMSLEGGMSDVLGELFMHLELGGHWHGQFFTPYEIAKMMALMTMGDVAPIVEREGFFTLNEPAAGAGAMVIACAEALCEQKVNYQRCMHVTAQDIDATAVHMCYIQLALLHVPAIVVHGNSLSLEEWAHWVTPAHVLGRWDQRLARRAPAEVPRMPVVVEQPEPAQVRDVIVRQRIEQSQQLSLFA